MGLKANIESRNEPFDTKKIHPGDVGKNHYPACTYGKSPG